ALRGAGGVPVAAGSRSTSDPGVQLVEAGPAGVEDRTVEQLAPAFVAPVHQRAVHTRGERELLLPRGPVVLVVEHRRARVLDHLELTLPRFLVEVLARGVRTVDRETRADARRD